LLSLAPPTMSATGMIGLAGSKLSASKWGKELIEII